VSIQSRKAHYNSLSVLQIETAAFENTERSEEMNHHVAVISLHSEFEEVY
jgi:hypothetical protein